MKARKKEQSILACFKYTTLHLVPMHDFCRLAVDGVDNDRIVVILEALICRADNHHFLLALAESHTPSAITCWLKNDASWWWQKSHEGHPACRENEEETTTIRIFFLLYNQRNSPLVKNIEQDPLFDALKPNQSYASSQSKGI